jgi:hypothetical protein
MEVGRMSVTRHSDLTADERATQALEQKELEELVNSLPGEDPNGPYGSDEMTVVWSRD